MIFVGSSGPIAKGAPIFRLDNSKQQAAAETARRKIAEIEAQMTVARADVAKAEGQLKEAESARQQTVDELEAKQELYRRNPGNVPFREIERLEVRAHLRRQHERRIDYRRDIVQTACPVGSGSGKLRPG